LAKPRAESDTEKLTEAGHWKRARALVKTRIAENPDDPFANYLLSQITHAFGEDASLNPLAAATQPPSYKARVDLAKFYLAPDHPNPSGAENAANKVLKLDRTRVEPWITLATLYTERGEWNASMAPSPTVAWKFQTISLRATTPQPPFSAQVAISPGPSATCASISNTNRRATNPHWPVPAAS
jgi:hypothetical protein